MSEKPHYLHLALDHDGFLISRLECPYQPGSDVPCRNVEGVDGCNVVEWFDYLALSDCWSEPEPIKLDVLPVSFYFNEDDDLELRMWRQRT